MLVRISRGAIPGVLIANAEGVAADHCDVVAAVGNIWTGVSLHVVALVRNVDDGLGGKPRPQC